MEKTRQRERIRRYGLGRTGETRHPMLLVGTEKGAAAVDTSVGRTVSSKD